MAWIDYDDLTYSLLKNFKGILVLSIGNYEKHNSQKYLIELNKNYDLINHYNLNMPWNLNENIRIFKKKNT